jgi:hypothetical protein
LDGLLRLKRGNVNLIAVFYHRPVILKLSCVVIVLLSMLVDERASAVQLTIDCLDGYLRAVVLPHISKRQQKIAF